MPVVLVFFGTLDCFLGQHPEYRGRLLFVQIGVPSRTQIEAYRRLEEELEAVISGINAKWSSGAWRPVIFIKEHKGHLQMMALHRLADCCIVTSLHDGMNLVAKEFVASRAFSLFLTRMSNYLCADI